MANIKTRSTIEYDTRPVQPSDVDAMTKIAVATWAQDDVWRYIFPRALQYSDLYYRGRRQHFQGMLAGWKDDCTSGLVAYRTDIVDSTGLLDFKIIGYVFWTDPHKNWTTSASLNPNWGKFACGKPQLT